MKLFIKYLFLLAVSLSTYGASVSSVNETTDTLTLSKLYTAILDYHPLVKSLSIEVDAARQMAQYADTRLNPKLEIGYWLEPIQTKAGPTNSKVSLSQKILPRSKLRLRKRVELGGVKILELETIKTIQNLKYDATKMFFEYNFLYKKLKILRQNLKLVESWTKLWETHYSHHNFRYPRLVQLQIEMTRIADQIREVEELIPNLFQQLTTLVDLQITRPLKPFYKDDLIEYNFTDNSEHNIDLMILEARLQKQKFNKSLEETSLIPNKTIKTEWTSVASRNDSDFNNPWMIGIGIDILVNRSQIKANVKSQSSAVKSLHIKLDYLKRDIQSRIRNSMFGIDNSRKRYVLLRDDLLPRTQESLESLQINYSSQANDMDFFGLLETLRALLNINLEIETTKKIYFQEVAQFERLSGSSTLQ
tara:strand:+ start:661 stop:1917 length:1257 start_codon:yes stop_codon:yes gene_type:complete